jgi:carboxylesterase
MVKRLYDKVKSVIFANPELIFEKERHLIGQPFYFEGSNGKAILLIHGWSSVPYEVRRLGIFLNENGYTVYGPLLRGHGTISSDLENVKWTDWLKDVISAYEKLKSKHGKVYVSGTSIGANLAVLLAKKKAEISGLIFLAMPYKLKLEPLVLFFLKILGLFKKYNKKYYPPTFGISTTITRLISYQTYPIKSVQETFEVVKISRKKLYEIKQPCFLIQSRSDHIIAKDSLEKIYSQIGSKIKKKKYIEHAYHTFISDIKNESVFEEILEFINEN